MNLNMEIKNEKIIIGKHSFELYLPIEKCLNRCINASDEEIIKKAIENISDDYISNIEWDMELSEADAYYEEYQIFSSEYFEKFHQLNMELSNKEIIKKMIREFLKANGYILEAILLELRYGKKMSWFTPRFHFITNEKVESEEEIEEIEDIENLEELELVED